MSHVMPNVGYPGGYSAFFTDLHLDFSRWLRLVVLVPIVHASIEGVSYSELCFHLLSLFPSSSVLFMSAERLRSSVAEMLFNEPFFICSHSDDGSSLSTSRWIYESSFDSDPSRISFAFSILRCINASPGKSVRESLSELTSVALLPSTSFPLPHGSRWQQDSHLAYGGHDNLSPQNTDTAAVRVPISSLIGPTASPSRTGLDSPSQLPPVMEPVVTIGPSRPRGPSNLPRGSVLVPVGLTTSRESFRPGTGRVASNLPLFHEVLRRSCSASEQSDTDVHVAEDMATNAPIGAQPKVPSSDCAVRLGQLPSQLSGDRRNPLGNPYTKIPLFLPSQTPNRDPFVQDLLSPQGSHIAHEGTSLSQGSPLRCTGQPYPDHSLANSLHTSKPQDFETEVQSNSQWPDAPVRDTCDASPESSHEPLGHQSASLTNANVLGKRGSVTHEAIPLGIPQTQSSIAPIETSISKQTRPAATPVHATSLDIPFSMASACARKTLTPSPPRLRTIGGHGEFICADQTNTFNSPVNKSEMQPPAHDRSRCALLTPSPSAPQSRQRQDSSLPGTSRPSVIVYKVATGPNLVGSRDVIRVSYGEGHRKRTHPTSFGHRNKDRKLGMSRHARPQKEYGSAKRDDTAKHFPRKSIRPKHCSTRRYWDGKRSPSADQQKADTEVSGNLPPAERVEGDMAWDFGAGPGTCLRRVDADRSRVRVGGLTSVRMIPRSAVDGEIGPAAIPTTT